MKNKLKTTRDLTHLPGRPYWGDGFEFWRAGHVADIITRAKFCDSLCRGFGVLITPILLFSIGIAGRPYNSVSTTVLHCDVDVKVPGKVRWSSV